MNYEGLIPILGGVVVLLMVFGIIPANNDPKKSEEWVTKWKPIMIWLAPFVIIFGFLLLFRVL